MAVLINANPFRSGKPAKPSDFHPYAAAQGPGRASRSRGTISATEFGRLLVANHR